MISSGLVCVQKAVLVGLFSWRLVFGGAYYRKEFCASEWVGLGNKYSFKHQDNSLKQLKTANPNRRNSLCACIREGLLSEGLTD